MTETAPSAMLAAMTGRFAPARTLTLLGLLAMIVLAGVALAGLTFESGDHVYRFFLAEAIVGAVTTACAIWWTAVAKPKGFAVTALVVSVVINPIWLMLLIRAFG